MASVLVYRGAGSDALPLMASGPWKAAIGDYVFVDGMPDSGYYPQFPDVNTLLGELKETYNTWSPSPVVSEVEVIPDKYWRFELAGARLHYFLNTKDTDAIGGLMPEELKDLLARASHMFIKGYTPDKRVMDLMPAASELGGMTIFASTNRLDDMEGWDHEHFNDWHVLKPYDFAGEPLDDYDYDTDEEDDDDNSEDGDEKDVAPAQEGEEYEVADDYSEGSDDDGSEDEVAAAAPPKAAVGEKQRRVADDAEEEDAEEGAAPAAKRARREPAAEDEAEEDKEGK